MNATQTATREAAGRNPNPKTDWSVDGLQPNAGNTLLTAGSASPRRNQLKPPGEQRTGRRKLALAVGLLGMAVLVGFGAYRWWVDGRNWVRTDNAYVAAHIHQISFRVAGTVKEVLVDENQAVEPDQILARLDPRDFELRVEQARAQVAQALAQTQQARALIAQAQAQVAQEQARATKALQDRQRAESLFHGSAGAISRQEYDTAQANWEAAQAALRAAESAGESANAQAAAAKAQEQVAESALQEARLQLSYTELRAPIRGRVGRKNLEAGNRVQPGQALLALVQPEVWVVANFKETQLQHVRPGQFVRLQVDAFPGQTFDGRVESLAPASGAQFALLPPDNATGNFTRIVQRIPVKIVFNPASLADCAGRIAAGMSSVVSVKVR